MDWGDLAKQVISLGAPMLGTALGGPLGGVAGEILAKAVGSVTITPTAVQTALPSVDLAKLAEAEAQWAEMIRAEIASSDPVQRWWRPAYAFELTLECAALWIVLVHEFWTGDIATINALVGATTLLVAYWGFRFGVLGVYISGRTREKVSAATGQDAPGMIEKIVKAVVKKK